MHRILLQKSWRQTARRDASAMSDCRKDFVRLRLAYGLPGNGLRKTRSRRQGRRFRGRFFRIRERSIVESQWSPYWPCQGALDEAAGRPMPNCSERNRSEIAEPSRSVRPSPLFATIAIKRLHFPAAPESSAGCPPTLPASTPRHKRCNCRPALMPANEYAGFAPRPL